MRKELSVCLFLFGLFLLNAPFLVIFDGVFLYYLFTVWALLILVLAISASRTTRDKTEK